MIWIEAENAILIHRRIIQATGGMDGLRDRASLKAAIAAPLQSYAGQDLFPSDIEKVARLGYGLAANHAFIDGNKWNGHHLELQKGELADMFIAIASSNAGEWDC